MNKITSFSLISALILVVFMSGCINEEFDKPPVLVPKVSFPSNISIADLKSTYTGTGVNLIGDSLITAADTIINPVIQGIVVANDESGNLYKTMIIRDASGGIELKLDKTGLYNEYRVGQRIFIKCKGLYLGNYGGLVQLGYIYQGSIGRIPQIMIPNHLFRDSLPGPAPVPQVKTISGLSAADLSTLVRFDAMHFDDADVGQEFAPQLADATNRTLLDASDLPILVRSSKYANFASNPVPAGNGSVVGVLSIYNGDYQLYIRDTKDLINFDPSAGGNVLLQDAFSTAPTGWISFSVASNKDWAHDATNLCMKANGYGGDVASDDWLISPAVNLTGNNNYILNFKTWTRYTDNGYPFPVEAFISTDYIGSGNPMPATWTPLSATFPAAHSQAWTSSGDISLNAYANQVVYIAFRYRSSGTSSSTSSEWRLDNFKLVGKP